MSTVDLTGVSVWYFFEDEVIGESRHRLLLDFYEERGVNLY